jgi:hypothetical protein
MRARFRCWPTAIAYASLGAVFCLAVLAVTRFAITQLRTDRGDALSGELSVLTTTADHSRAGDTHFSGFPYRSVASTLRAGDSQGNLSPDSRLSVARLEKAIGGDRSPRALHSLGVAFAIERRLDDRVNALRESTGQGSGDAKAWTDLAGWGRRRSQSAVQRQRVRLSGAGGSEP